MSSSPKSAHAGSKKLRVTVGKPEVLETRRGPCGQPAADDARQQSGSVAAPHMYRGPDEPESKVAVLVCHGMGQQVPFETLDSVATAIAGATKVEDVTVRHVRIGEKCFPRAEVTVRDREGRARAVHVYESHWAPLMEGRVSARDVTRFLFGAGFAGLKHALSGSFDRWMFGGRRHLPISPFAPFWLLLAFAFIVSGLALYATLAFVAVAKAGEFLFLANGAWNGAPLVDALTFELFRSPLALSLVASPLMLWFKQRSTRSGVPIRAGTWIARGVLSVAALAAVVAVLIWAGAPALLAVAAHWRVVLAAVGVAAGIGVVGWLLARGGRLGLPLTGLFAVLIGWTIFSAVMIVLRFGQWVNGAIAEGWATSLVGWKDALMDGADTPFYLVFLACSVVLCTAVRWFYIQYFGDVAAYLASHTVNKFHEVRGQIKAIGLETARAVYGARSRRNADAPEYDRVLVVGHSLGSVVAYDTLNAVLNEDATGAGLDVLARTQALITFGSPLDKSAFIFRTQVKNAEGREALAAAVQPLIHPGNGVGRTTRWINIYSPYDPISGTISFYDPPKNERAELGKHRPVKNVRDPDANIPAVAHNQYWANPTLARWLKKLVTAPLPVRAPAAEPAPEPAPVHASVA
jgi:hypothetical protein